MSSCHPLSCSAFFIAAEDGQAFLHLKEWISGVEKVIEQKTQWGMNPGTIQQVAQVHSNSPKKVAGLGCGLIKKWTTRAPISAKNRCKKQKSQTSQENSMTLWQKVSKVLLCLPWADIEPHSSVSQVLFSWLKASQKAGTQGYPTPPKGASLWQEPTSYFVLLASAQSISCSQPFQRRPFRTPSYFGPCAVPSSAPKRMVLGPKGPLGWQPCVWLVSERDVLEFECATRSPKISRDASPFLRLDHTLNETRYFSRCVYLCLMHESRLDLVYST